MRWSFEAWVLTAPSHCAARHSSLLHYNTVMQSVVTYTTASLEMGRNFWKINQHPSTRFKSLTVTEFPLTERFYFVVGR